MNARPSAAPGARLRRSMIREALENVRNRTLAIVEPLSSDALTRQHDPLMSPIIWDLGHIGAFEELWLVRRPGAVTSESELEAVYDAFRTPRSVRGELKLPGPGDVLDRMADVRQRALEMLSEADFSPENPLLRDGFAWDMVIQHEAQHQETILQTIHLMTRESYRPAFRRSRPAGTTAPRRAPRPAEMVAVPGGTFDMGARKRGFAYDNERPRHAVEVAPFRIGKYPVTNGEWAAFVAAGGYLDEGLWTEAGWAWREEAGLAVPQYWEPAETVPGSEPTSPQQAAARMAAEGLEGWRQRTSLGARALPADLPVCHVCAHEADAYARFAARRLPTEVEWEMAAAHDPTARRSRAYPWGDSSPTVELANLGQASWGPDPIGSHPAGASAAGVEQMLGDVWEWTSSTFGGYPQFEAFPYAEYSEVFFGDAYRVLRGGSWATRPSVARNTFRNWDYPIRRQIFSGLRLAEDA